MIDDLVTLAFLILVCIMCGHQSGCVRLCNDSGLVCVCEGKLSLLQDVWEGSGQTGVANGSWLTLNFHIRLLIPVFFLLLNIKMSGAFFLSHFYLYFKKLHGQKAIHLTS